jgi:serine/threonine-protein kinase
VLGTLPFKGDSVGRLILEICSRPLPVPSEVANVPKGFDSWFARACSRDPERRFASAKQAAAEFVRIAESEPEPLPIAKTLTFEANPTEVGAEPMTETAGNSVVTTPPTRRSRKRQLQLVAISAAAACSLATVVLVGLRTSARRAQHEVVPQQLPAPATPAAEAVVETKALAPSPAPAAPPPAAPEPAPPEPRVPAPVAEPPAAAAALRKAGSPPPAVASEAAQSAAAPPSSVTPRTTARADEHPRRKAERPRKTPAPAAVASPEPPPPEPPAPAKPAVDLGI